MSDIFPASNIVPAKGYLRAKEIAYTIDLKSDERIGLLASNVTADDLWSWFTDIVTVKALLEEIAAIPNIAIFAAEQEDNPLLDEAAIVAGFNRMLAALVAAGTWIYTALPRDANGYLLVYTTTPLGEMLPRTFTPAQTAPLIPLLQEICNSIG
jgi:hypothetical protein